MNRREFAFVSLTSSAGLLVGCDTDPKPDHTATLFNSSEVQEAVQSIEAAIADFESDVVDFDTENWREVVPKVKASTDEIGKRLTS